jgi:predicted dehydrogenase
MGLVGPGFIAAHHIDAVRRLGTVEVVAIAGANLASANRRAAELNVARAYGDYLALIRDPDVEVIHNTTPNHLHFPVVSAALAAGKHVISDKPLAMTLQQSQMLCRLARKALVAHVVTFNYRGNPLVQQARCLVEKGELGPLSFIHGQYFQDWMTDPNVYSWRSDPMRGGASSALGDIGSHWCDLAEHVSGARIVEVLAELTTVVATRYTADSSSGAFAGTIAASRTPIGVVSEDLATVLLRFDNGAKGCLSVGQALPGHNNDLRIELNGRTASLEWRQERQNELWFGRCGQSNLLIDKDPALLEPAAARYARLPAGHQEGWADAFRNVIADAYEWIWAGAAPERKPPATATFEDGYRNHRIIDAMLRSHAGGGVWTSVVQPPEDWK